MGTLPHSVWLNHGKALHLQHGPIDLVVGCRGSAVACARAYSAIATGFDSVLATLVAELSLLKTPLSLTARNLDLMSHSNEFPIAYLPTASEYGLSGPVAQRMYDACVPFASESITPMASVAGAVADHLLSRVTDLQGIECLWVNNGGDIAVFIAPGFEFSCGMMSDVSHDELTGQLGLSSDSTATCGSYYGIATSGRASFGSGGRSFSMGVADAVTVVAPSAARADAAATIVANHVDWSGSDAKVERKPATDFDPDSDLGDRLVVTGVHALTNAEIDRALTNGLSTASMYCDRGFIDAAALSLGGRYRCTGLFTDNLPSNECAASPVLLKQSLSALNPLTREHA